MLLTLLALGAAAFGGYEVLKDEDRREKAAEITAKTLRVAGKVATEAVRVAQSPEFQAKLERMNRMKEEREMRQLEKEEREIDRMIQELDNDEW